MQRTHPFNLFVCLFFSLSPVSLVWATGSYHGGDGTAENPFQILTAAHLRELSQHTEDYSKHFILIADIDLDPDIPGNQIYTQAVIAPSDSDTEIFSGTPFTGTFDGSGHRIKNLTFQDPVYSFLGLFGNIDTDGTVLNLGVENVTFKDYSFDNHLVSFFTGQNNGTLIHCYATGKRNIEYGYNHSYAPQNIGGIAGRNKGYIFDCYSKGQIIGGQYAGGLVGHNEDGYIDHCFSDCSLINCDAYTGGLVGANIGTAVISYSYATGSLQDTYSYYLGGLVGYSYGYGSNQETVINRCYATGSVPSGNGLIGEALGYAIIKNCYAVGAVADAGLLKSTYPYSIKVINCFWDTDTSGSTYSNGGTGLTTEQMKQMQSFTDADWDFYSTWDMIEGRTYPFFQWQENPLENMCKDSLPFPVGDLNSDCTVDLSDFSLFAQHWMEDIRR